FQCLERPAVRACVKMAEPYTMSAKVKEEAERRRKEEEEERERKKAEVSERMKKMAGQGGAAPGFATAQLGAEIAAVTKKADDGGKRTKGGNLNVKAIVKETEEENEG
ncbi:Uncharacterized protein SCF082_LOCUS32550, partial [Durusdinium trenchii]